MASLYYLIAVFFFLCCLTTSFAQENSTTQGGNKTTFFGSDTKPMNKTTNLTICELDITDFEINEVLSKHDNTMTTTNIVRITVSVVSENKTRHRRKMELAWASEVGRTILTLVRRAKDTIFTSPLFTKALEVGTEEVDIHVKGKIDGCLPPGEPGSELIFNSLLRRLSHNDDAHFFKLCKAHNDETTQYTTFNCCRIVGDGNLAICADYSSVVVKWALPMVGIIFGITACMVVPFVLQYIITYLTNEFYKMSDNPMSLVSLTSLILFEGRGPIKSCFRRCLFVGISYVVSFYLDFFGHLWLVGLFLAWVLIFLFFNDIQMTYEAGKIECMKKRHLKCNCTRKCCKCFQKYKKECTDPELNKHLISCFTLPFSFLFSLYQKIDDSFESDNNICCKSFCYHFLKELSTVLLILFLLICCPCILLFCLIKFFLINLLLFFIVPHHDCGKMWQKVLFAFQRLLTIGMIIFFTGMIFVFVLSLVASFTLNAEFFNPFIVPILTIITYLSKNWRWSVEAKCLQLKTLIIEFSIDEVDKDKVAPQNDKQQSADGTSASAANDNIPTCIDRFLDFLRSGLPRCRQHEAQNGAIGLGNNDNGEPTTSNIEPTTTNGDPTTSNIELTTTNGDPTTSNIEPTTTNGEPTTSNGHNNAKENIIKFDQHGEAMISKELYQTIRKKVLDLDHILFYFFRRVVFVLLYCLCLLVVMILARDSGVPETVQIIGSIVGLLVPFVFDNIFAELHVSQRNSEEAAMKQKLKKHILKVTKQENNTILVELKKRNNQSGTAETCV